MQGGCSPGSRGINQAAKGHIRSRGADRNFLWLIAASGKPVHASNPQVCVRFAHTRLTATILTMRMFMVGLWMIYSLSAQTPLGGIAGTVVGPDGLALPRAVVQ